MGIETENGDRGQKWNRADNGNRESKWESGQKKIIVTEDGDKGRK